jgi:hypothetical protein
MARDGSTLGPAKGNIVQMTLTKGRQKEHRVDDPCGREPPKGNIVQMTRAGVIPDLLREHRADDPCEKPPKGTSCR